MKKTVSMPPPSSSAQSNNFEPLMFAKNLIIGVTASGTRLGTFGWFRLKNANKSSSNVWTTFWTILKFVLLRYICCGYIWANLRSKLGYVLIQHLVTLLTSLSLWQNIFRKSSLKWLLSFIRHSHQQPISASSSIWRMRPYYNWKLDFHPDLRPRTDLHNHKAQTKWRIERLTFVKDQTHKVSQSESCSQKPHTSSW